MERPSNCLPDDDEDWQSYREWAKKILIGMKYDGDRWLTVEKMDEIIDDACMALQNYDPEHRSGAKITTFFYRTIINLKVNAWREHERDLENHCYIDDFEDYEDGFEAVHDQLRCPLVETPEEIYFKAEWRDLLFQAIETLPERERFVLKLFYFEGWKIEAIANKFKLPVGTVKSDLYNARKKLHELCAELNS